jgi:hypothetical protein
MSRVTQRVLQSLLLAQLMLSVGIARAQTSDVAHTLDFDRDGIDDPIVYRPTTGLWAIKSSSDPTTALLRQWGLPKDHPIAGDYTGDGIADLVVWRPANGNWYICKSDANFNCFANNGNIVQQFGLFEDKPIKADYDGDGILDLAVWRPSLGLFIYRRSGTGEVAVTQWGLPGDIPIQTGPNK